MRNPNPTPHSDPDVSTRFHEELARAAAMPALAPAGPALWPGFAGYYQGLTRLPRRPRRALQRRWRCSLGGIALLCALGPAAMAATINVDETCLLINAINSANSNTSVTGCESGSGADTIVLTNGRRVFGVDNSEFGPTGFPVIRSQITIQGNGNRVFRDGNGDTIPEFRIFAVGVDGDLTLENTRVSGGVVSGGEGNDSGGIHNFGTLTLTNSTVSGNTAGDDGGGISNNGTLTLTNSTVSGNTAGDNGGGINNNGTMTLTISTASGNTAQFGGGIDNDGTMTLTNSTVSGNAASIDGGGIDNFGTVTLTNSTASGNLAGSRGGGISNSATGIVTLVQTLLSGNTASTDGSEAHQALGTAGDEGTVIADDFNLFGHDGLSGVVGFSPGTFDIVPSEPLAAILDTTLRNNGGPTLTHALVTGSPAIDFAPCVAATDQRGVTRPQDADADSDFDCDTGAFELQLPPTLPTPPTPPTPPIPPTPPTPPTPPAPPPPPPPPPIAAALSQNPQLGCTGSACRIPIQCNGSTGTVCNISVKIAVARRIFLNLRPGGGVGGVILRDDRSAKAAQVPFAAGVTNVPAGQIANVKLGLRKAGKLITRTSTRKRIRGVMEIRTSTGAFSSISSIPVRLKLP